MNLNNFNSAEYSFVDINVNMLGSNAPIDGILGIKWSVERDIKEWAGRGGQIVARVRGSKKYTGSIDMLYSTYLAILAGLAPGKDATDLRGFPVTITMANENNPTIHTVVLKNVMIKKAAEEFKEGDLGQVITLDLSIIGIEHIS